MTRESPRILSRRNLTLFFLILGIGGLTTGLAIYSIITYYDPLGSSQVVLIIEGPLLPSPISITDHDLKTNFSIIDNQYFLGNNSFGSILSGYYTGASVFSILEETGVMDRNPIRIRFQSPDAYYSDFIPLNLVQNFPYEIIIAWARNGQALTPLSLGGEGPLRSLVNRTVIPSNINTPYWVKDCTKIYVE